MSKKHKFTERDITINDMYSRSGKATENMHLTLANVKKMKREQANSESRADAIREKMGFIQNSKTIVS